MEPESFHPWKRKISFQTIILRFYVNLRGCRLIWLSTVWGHLYRRRVRINGLHGLAFWHSHGVIILNGGCRCELWDIRNDFLRFYLLVFLTSSEKFNLKQKRMMLIQSAWPWYYLHSTGQHSKCLKVQARSGREPGHLWPTYFSAMKGWEARERMRGPWHPLTMGIKLDATRFFCHISFHGWIVGQ